MLVAGHCAVLLVHVALFVVLRIPYRSVVLGHALDALLAVEAPPRARNRAREHDLRYHRFAFTERVTQLHARRPLDLNVKHLRVKPFLVHIYPGVIRSFCMPRCPSCTVLNVLQRQIREPRQLPSSSCVVFG